ncbi:hypothetical protein INT47_012249 [Mucor saturninus]|uniref:Ras-GEF domain-containing protein n=1 Tax=Mucor saturninus TaxID=64648 RepID=A0A8H7RCN3_9FUNG|nr:hypothetical protein INT47_012249 [Mucor saturninus]
MASASNNHNSGGLPVIPLSPIAQSFIICKNAINQASDKLTEAKKVRPHLGVDVLRGFLETVKLERHRLDTLTRKMQSVEAATSLFWDSDALARQIAVIDCQLYSSVLLDKRSLSQLDAEATKLVHLVDFHHYLTHSFAHQLIYWAELTKPENGASAAVVPPVHTKDSLITHLVRVAYLLLHAYRDFSGFAAIMKALTVPEVRRLKKLWQPCSSRTKDMFRDLAQIVAPAKNYQAYHTCLRTKLDVHHHTGSGGMMIAIPWIQPHLLSIRSIVTAYTAGDDHDQQHTGDIVLSAPGAHKLNIELSILELCQHNSTIDTASANEFLLEDILTPTDKKSKRASMATSKAIHIEGLRAAVIPVGNLNHLAPGDQLTHHWLVSRVYLRKDQLINESIEVEPLKPGESITCDKDEFEEAMSQQTKYLASRPVSVISRRTSIAPPEPTEDIFEQELVDIVRTTRPESINDSTDENDDDNDEDQGGLDVVVDTKSIEIPLVSPVEESNIEEHEVTLHPTTTIMPELEHQNEPRAATQSPESVNKPQSVVEEEDEYIEVIVEDNKDPLLGHEVPTKEVEPEQEQERVDASNYSGSSSSNSTSVSKQKSRLSPTAPEFVPGGASSNQGMGSGAKKPSSVNTSTSDERWLGYPVKDEEEEVRHENGSERWNGYPEPQKGTQQTIDEEDEDDEIWRGYPEPNSSTGSPRHASSQSDASIEWKGYQATKEEANWQIESQLKVQEHEWQGYALETLDEDELDSSTMMDGEFEKSRHARGQQGKEDQLMENFKRKFNV